LWAVDGSERERLRLVVSPQKGSCVRLLFCLEELVLSAVEVEATYVCLGASWEFGLGPAEAWFFFFFIYLREVFGAL